MWSAHAVQYSNFFHIAIGEDNPMAHIQITGTRVRMKFVLYGASCGYTINFRLSNAIAVMLKVDTNNEVA